MKTEKANSRPVFEKNKYRLCYYYEFELQKMPETSFLKINQFVGEKKMGQEMTTRFL